ncbi:acyl-CoA N-acyltransferase [Lipomyces japonicus]|uniref:acyl-CoA N-acyltransferase n=1 Tax=Lipomyces japonicus TaxID=56871 RepID=UPI0034CF7445
MARYSEFEVQPLDQLRSFNLPFAKKVFFEVSFSSDAELTVSVASAWTFKFSILSSTLTLGEHVTPSLLWISLYAILTHDVSLQQITIANPDLLSNVPLFLVTNHDDALIATRQVFFQYSPQPTNDTLAWLGYNFTNSQSTPDYLLVAANGRKYPARPTKPSPGQALYSRYIPTLQKSFDLRVVDISENIDLFAAWMNKDRVANFWNMKGNVDEVHRPYLNTLAKDKHVIPAFGYLDQQPFLYTELYYVSEDHLAPFVDDLGPHDMGFHLLVGSEDHRGPAIVSAWLPSIAHYLFLLDLRTNYIFLEPRVDNYKLQDYLIKHGFSKLKEFDFPHKRAALFRISRREFFTTGPAP